MDTEHNEILSELVMLRTSVTGDFASLALGIGDSRLFRWTLVSGNETERSEAMRFRSGQGVGGQAVQIGRPMAWNDTDAALFRLCRECPLMLAERLRTAVTAPVAVQRKSRGVVLVGSRTGHVFTREDMAAVTLAAHRIGRLLDTDPLRDRVR